MATWVFPGQGSQVKGMGKELFDYFPKLAAKADALLGYSLKALCFSDPGGRLTQTQYTQPALYVVNALYFYKKLEETGQKPDFVTGSSLGEYNALLAAEAFDFETGLRLVKKRGDLMAQATGGAMAAVSGPDEEGIVRMLRENGLSGIDIANLNSPSQIVISGLADEIHKAVKLFKDRHIACIPLKVGGAFHSRYMGTAREEFENFIKKITFSEPSIPTIANVSARPYKGTEIALNLVNQMTHAVRWTETIQYLLGKGETVFEEVGPGRVLTNLITKIKKQGRPPAAEADLPLPPLRRHVTGGTKGACPGEITAASLGDGEFKQDYNLKYAYLTGAMAKGIASEELVIRIGKAGMMGFFGTGGLALDRIEAAIGKIRKALRDGQSYGMNLLYHLNNPRLEEQTVDLFLKHGVRNVEAAAYMQISPALVRYRLEGLERGAGGEIKAKNRIIAKLSRPEIARAFMSPAPERLVGRLLSERRITKEQAELSRKIAMADDLCVEADSGGHTDQGIMMILVPAMIRLRDEMTRKHGYTRKIRVGAAGGIGTPEAAATAFILGADFILTGSINQCTAEAGTSDGVKDILQDLDVQDTGYAPAGDLFGLGAKVQVVKKGLFFPVRATKLYELYRRYNSLDEIDERTRRELEEKYFKGTFDSVYAETRAYYSQHLPEEIERAEQNPKQKMALVFRWYFVRALRLAMEGKIEEKVDFQIYCGPAMGAFNQWVKGTEIEAWRNRHVDGIAERLMQETAVLLNHRLMDLTGA